MKKSLDILNVLALIASIPTLFLILYWVLVGMRYMHNNYREKMPIPIMEIR
jgi:hypothetical protein